MAASSDAGDAGPSKTLQAGLQAVATALATTPLDALAAAISKDDTVACKVRAGQANTSLPDAVRLLYAAGLRVVPADKVCIDRATYEAMATIATRAMAHPDIARRITLDE